MIYGPSGIGKESVGRELAKKKYIDRHDKKRDFSSTII